jgi:hypothetical protein
MDKILDAAEKRRDEIRQELKKLDEFLILYRALANSLPADSVNTNGTFEPDTVQKTPVNNSELEAARETESTDATPARRVRVRDNPKPEVVVAEAVKLIREKNRPMTRREIREGLVERNIVVNGADPVKALGTMLWRSGADLLVQVDGRGYWPAGVPVPELTMGELVNLTDED